MGVIGDGSRIVERESRERISPVISIIQGQSLGSLQKPKKNVNLLYTSCRILQGGNRANAQSVGCRLHAPPK